VPAAPSHKRPQLTTNRASGLAATRTIPSFSEGGYPPAQCYVLRRSLVGHAPSDSSPRLRALAQICGVSDSPPGLCQVPCHLNYSECNLSSTMRRSAIRALEGSIAATHAPKSALRGLATVKHGRQKVRCSDPAHWKASSSVLGSGRTRSNHRISKWHSGGH
jgi:hypothetical protein